MSSKQSSPKAAPKPTTKKTEVMNTGVKIDGKTVYFTKGLKNPLSGFFFKTAGGKKNKILMKNVVNEASKSALANVVKKHSNAAPAGKVMNPLTGRFVKAVEEKPTFEDPISLGNVKFADGIELNKQWYAKKSLRKMIDSGNSRVPHSRRNMTNTEINAIFTGKNGKKIARKVVAKHNSNSNNNITIEEMLWRAYGPIDGGLKELETVDEFKTFMSEGILDYMGDHDTNELTNLRIRISEYPRINILVNANTVYRESEIHLQDVLIKVRKGRDTKEFRGVTGREGEALFKFLRDPDPNSVPRVVNLTSKLRVEDGTSKNFEKTSNFVHFAKNILAYLKSQDIGGMKNVKIHIKEGNKTFVFDARRFVKVSRESVGNAEDVYVEVKVTSPGKTPFVKQYSSSNANKANLETVLLKYI